MIESGRKAVIKGLLRLQSEDDFKKIIGYAMHHQNQVAEIVRALTILLTDSKLTIPSVSEQKIKFFSHTEVKRSLILPALEIWQSISSWPAIANTLLTTEEQHSLVQLLSLQLKSAEKFKLRKKMVNTLSDETGPIGTVAEIRRKEVIKSLLLIRDDEDFAKVINLLTRTQVIISFYQRAYTFDLLNE